MPLTVGHGQQNLTVLHTKSFTDLKAIRMTNQNVMDFANLRTLTLLSLNDLSG